MQPPSSSGINSSFSHLKQRFVKGSHFIHPFSNISQEEDNEKLKSIKNIKNMNKILFFLI